MSLPIVIIVFLAFTLLLLAFLYWQFRELKKTQKPSQELLDIMRILQDASREDRKVLLESMQKNTDSIGSRMLDVQKSLGEVSEIGRSIKDFQEFLKSPKLRGNIGEQVLKELLGQMLPKDSFHLQYTFKTGERVDAAIKTSGGIIPIDSKFPMENFRLITDGENDEVKSVARKQFVKDVKAHIDAIAGKYILPHEGTIDYALMYIPAESVYYEICNNQELFDWAGRKRVLPVSPSTFYAYLKTILMSMEGQKIELKAREILTNLKSIQSDYEKANKDFSVLQRHLGNAGNVASQLSFSFGSLGKKIDSMGRLEGIIPKPIADEAPIVKDLPKINI